MTFFKHLANLLHSIADFGREHPAIAHDILHGVATAVEAVLPGALVPVVELADQAAERALGVEPAAPAPVAPAAQ